MRQGQEEGQAERPTLPRGESLTGAPGPGPGELGLIDRLRSFRSQIDSAIQEALAGDGHVNPGDRRAAAIEMLVAGEPIGATSFDYKLEGYHLALVTTATATVAEAVQATADQVGGDLLLIERGRDVWAWFGSPRQRDVELFDKALSTGWHSEQPVGVGESSAELAGWRSSHRQARAARSIAPVDGGLVRYSDVALLASVSGDDLLTISLRRNYLAPLERERDGGEVLRGTLRAYFDSDRNVSATASILGVSRNTVTNRLRAIESRTERPFADFALEYEAALRLDGLSRR